jgi:polyisoprenoid-binding protein YceI
MRLLAVLALLFALPAAAAPWKIDKAHTHITFSVDNLGFSFTQGRFENFDASIDFDPENVEATEVTFTIDAKSIDTLSKARDRHLRSEAFLDVKNHPEIRFVSEKVRLIDENSAEITGQLTMKGVTREETFAAELIRIGPNPFAKDSDLAGFVVTGELDRTNFGVSYGAPAIGVKVPIRLDLQIMPVK